MLRHTFCHLSKVGVKTERRIWSAGHFTWEEALVVQPSLPRLSTEELRESARRHLDLDAAWFNARLPASQSWRLFADFRSRCAYVDVETTGMSRSAVVTTIALYDGRSLRTYVRGRNLRDFSRDIRRYRLLITYNGKSFDLPMLRDCLDCRLDQAHIDLRQQLAVLGFRGGLKACERRLGMVRPGMEYIDGYIAVLLWRQYERSRDALALETLLAYNVQDAVNLEALMVHVHNENLARLMGAAPFATRYRLTPPAAFRNPFAPDPDVVLRAYREARIPTYLWDPRRGAPRSSSNH